MRIVNLILSINIIILFTGCTAKTNNYTQTVRTWHGGNVNSLVKSWGIPDNKLNSPSGGVTYIYKTQGNKNILTSEVAAQSQNPYWDRDTSVMCMTLFEADITGKILNTHIQGSGCYGGENKI